MLNPAPLLLKIFIILALNSVFCGAAEILYVDRNAPAEGARDGSTWSNAFTDLQSALFATDDTKEIRVAAGTYSPDIGTGQLNNSRESTFRLQNNLTLYGGFPTGGSALEERNPEENHTVLSGDLGSTNAYHVLTAADTDNTAVIDGFTITLGLADGEEFPENSGAGLLCRMTGSPVIKNCIFSRNFASDQGGAIYGSQDAQPILIQCLFETNQADSAGGAIANWQNDPILTECVFNYNSAEFGGAVHNAYSKADYQDCTFEGNSSSYGGAVYNFDFRGGERPDFTNCIFSGNQSAWGGAIYNWASTSYHRNCTFQGNRSIYDGGAVYDVGGWGSYFYNCIIWNNQARDSSDTPSASVATNGDIDAQFYYCIIANSGGSDSWSSEIGYDGGDNLDVDPLFVSSKSPNLAPSRGSDLRIRSDSPAIDIGDNETNISPKDFVGNDRIQNGAIDLGAYEGGVIIPTVVSLSRTSADLDQTTLEFALKFSEEVFNFTLSDLKIFASGSLSFTDTAITGTESNYTITLNGVSGEGVFTVLVKNQSGLFNANREPLYTSTSIDSLVLFSSTSTTHYTKAGNPNASAPYDTWETAAADLQDALLFAVPGDTVFVTQGSYYPDRGSLETINSRNSSFLLKPGVAIYGGFDGTEDSLDQRNPLAHLTVLSGDIGIRDDARDNSYHVVTGSGSDATSILNGFTIIHGNANGGNSRDNFGGGFTCQGGGSPLVANCSFRGNQAKFRGGAIYNCTFSSPAFINCEFQGNTAFEGGAICNNDGSSPIITNCTFQGNLAVSNGGAIFSNDSAPKFTNCLIWNNQAGSARDTATASLFSTNSFLTFSHCLVENFIPSGLNNLDGTRASNNPLFIIESPPASAPSVQGDLRLLSGSPVIDLGNSSANTSIKDLAYNDRIQNDEIDLGAYEGTLDSPSVTSLTLTSGSLDVDSLGFDLVFNSDITGFSESDLEITASGTASYSGISINGSGRQYSLTLNNTSGEGFFNISIKPNSGLIGANGIPMMSFFSLANTLLSNSTSKIHYVAANNPNPAAPYDTWETAATNLNDALVFATSGDQVWLSTGTYLPTERTRLQDDRSATFTLKNGVAIYGGFEGSETKITHRNPARNPTTLSGDLGVVGDGSDNAYHVLTGTGTNNTATLDSVTITGGNANGSKIADNFGGGLTCDSSGSAKLTNCIFIHNQATFRGGAVYSCTTASPHFTNCSFLGNLSADGGAVCNNDSSSSLFINCSFQGNNATQGGAIYNNNSTPVFTNCIVWNNQANGTTTSLSASIENIDSTPTFSHCLIQNLSLEEDNNLDGSLPRNNPRFLVEIDPAFPFSSRGVLSLRPDSPAINKGNNSANPTDFDISGSSRIHDGTINLGAYEEPLTPPTVTALTLDSNPTDATSLNFSLNFSREVFGFSKADLEITPLGEASYSDATISGSGTDYIITLHDTAGEGFFNLRIVPLQSLNALNSAPLLEPFTLEYAPIYSSANHIHFVNVDNPGATAPFDSWSSAATTLQDALAYAAPGDQIWVASGTYYPDEGIGQTKLDPTSTFQLRNEIAIHGGFNGTEARLQDRPATIPPTIFSGRLRSDADSTVYAEHIITGTGTGPTALLNHVTITHGSSEDSLGSALICEDGASPTFTHCRFEQNSASNGAILYLNNGSSPKFTDCNFHENQAGLGGSVYNLNHSSPIFTNCSFRGNRAIDGRGGAVYNEDSSAAFINCIFQGNKADLYGGAICNFQSSPELVNCSFQGNSASVGGALFNQMSFPALSNCIIWNNKGQVTGQNDSGKSNSIFIAGGGQPSSSHSLIQYYSKNDLDDGDSTKNNFHPLAPRFKQETSPDSAPSLAGDLNLLPDSAVIDGGLNSANSNATDHLGNPRQVGPIDLGAYEVKIDTLWNSDFDRDGFIYGLEQALGTDPHTSDPENIRHPILTESRQLSFGINPTASPETRWIIRRSTDLLDFSEIIYGPSPTPPSLPFVDPTSLNRAFYLLEVQLGDN